MDLDISHAACKFVYTLTTFRQPSLCAALYVTTVNGSQTYSWFLAHQEEEKGLSIGADPPSPEAHLKNEGH